MINKFIVEIKMIITNKVLKFQYEKKFCAIK